MWVNPKYFFVGMKAVRYPLTAGKKKKKRRNKFWPDPPKTRRKVCFLSLESFHLISEHKNGLRRKSTGEKVVVPKASERWIFFSTCCDAPFAACMSYTEQCWKMDDQGRLLMTPDGAPLSLLEACKINAMDGGIGGWVQNNLEELATGHFVFVLFFFPPPIYRALLL